MTNQDKKPDSFAVFILICLGITLIVSITHEIIFTWSK
jgi:hypothetical protein